MNVRPSPAAVMTREEIDRAIAELEVTRTRLVDAISSVVEGHRGHRYLRDHSVAGLTLEVWQDLEPRLHLLRTHYAVLDSMLAKARQVRERRDRPELTRLLTEGVVGLGADGKPVSPDADEVIEKVTLHVLSDRLEKAYTDIITVLTRVDEASRTVTAQLSTLASLLNQIRTRAATLGARQDPGLVRLVAALAELSRSAVGDPLGTVEADTAAAEGGTGPVHDGLRVLEADARALDQRLAGLCELKVVYPQRMEALRRLVDAVAMAEEAAHQAYSAATTKILDPDLVRYTEQRARLRVGLDTLERYERGQRWQRIAEVLPELERSAREALDNARERAGEATALLTRREELRGRLDGYRAKADRLGLGEHAELSALYREAWDLLWTAPCDLKAAARAVWQYQELLANPPDGEGYAT